MADPKKRLMENAPGNFYVDSTCINCGTCRELAPAVFGDSGSHAFVKAQPAGEKALRQAARALLSCPTASIGSEKNGISQVKDDFPIPIEEEVYYCGFTSSKSYGGSSYFIRHPEGNWLVDSPRFIPFLEGRIEAMGGLRYIFLTHRDDVADADKYARRFGARRIIHEADLSAAPGAEIRVQGAEPWALAPDFTVIPVPGHTRGHCALLYKNKFLFSGDHLEWDPAASELHAFRDYCWYDWGEQIRSMERLLEHRFEWVLPGHGQRRRLPAEEMKSRLLRLISRMKEP